MNKTKKFYILYSIRSFKYKSYSVINNIHLSHSLELEYDTRLNMFDDGTLMIRNVQESDQGVYQCMARNSAGEAQSHSAVLQYSSLPGKACDFLPDVKKIAPILLQQFA